MKELNTDRMYLRKITEDDCERIFSCWASDDEITKHLTWRTHQSVETTTLVVAHWLKAYENEKCYWYGIELKETKELIGMIDVVGYRDGSPVIGYVQEEPIGIRVTWQRHSKLSSTSYSMIDIPAF